MSSFDDIFQGFFRNSSPCFGDWEIIYLAEHLLMAASACGCKIIASTARVLEQAKNSIDNRKQQLNVMNLFLFYCEFDRRNKSYQG